MKYLLVFIFLILVGCKSQSTVLLRGSVSSCGGFTKSATKDENLSGAARVFGQVLTCPKQEPVRNAQISIYNSKNELTYRLKTDNNGKYDCKIIPGVYHIDAREISSGHITTGEFMFNYKDAAHVDLYLYDGIGTYN